MKASITYWTIGGFDGAVPVVEAAHTAQELGFDAIELSFGIGELTPATDPTTLSRLGEAIRAEGVEIASLCTDAYWEHSLGSPDPNEQEAAIEFTAAYIRAARALGTDAVLVIPGTVDVPWDPTRPVVPAPVVHDIAQESIAQLLPVAEEEDVVIALENVWGKFLTGPFEYRTFIDSFGSPHVKAYFDVGNVVVNGYPEDWIDVLNGRIERVHVKNFQRQDGGGTLNDFTDNLMQGDVRWDLVFRSLKEVGYDGYLTAEMLVSDQELPDTDLAAQVAQDLREMIEFFC